ncbi:MAG TPA: methylenetetrahydrofolate--tRNA-(uracil(54)-C(5))-methyltransferase (FADH(2)-oxidizing) TrmFO, partial [Kiritimatiellae bacterium]|nr:methylenetetrahydrofolate--tRNA-(uracil(54)-C(5))-methyltransferase (FADH(2)-oxidizing) TrmFO [Kiritimatiellia bacterium]
ASLRGFETELEGGVKAGRGAFFERCLPVEVLAARGDLTLAHGPMRPTGLVDPSTGRRPFAVLQLRRDDVAGRLYNLVGMQTNLLYAEQERVFRLIPALRRAEFARYGQMHRNTFLCSPKVINGALRSRWREDLFFAGQLTGIEGYAGNIASGWVAGVNAARLVRGQSPVVPPPETMTGALCRYVYAADPSAFQPIKANFGLLAAVESSTLKGRERHRWLAARGLARMRKFLREIGLRAAAGVPDAWYR